MPTSTGKFARLRSQVMGTASDDIPVPFRIRCDCGRTVKGERGPRWQRLVCPGCRTDLYLMPVNVYPRTASVPSEVIGGSLVSRLGFAVGAVFRGVRESGSQPSDDPRSPTPAPGLASEPAEAEPLSPRTSLRERLPSFRIPRPDVRGLIRRTLTPFRLIILATAAVMAVTGWWMWQRQAIEAARETWLVTTDAVPRLLSEGNLTELHQQLAEGVPAGRLLGRNDESFRVCSNLLGELDACLNLSNEDLVGEILKLDEADDDRLSSYAQLLTDRFHGHTIVMEAAVEPSSDSGYFRAVLPLMPGNRPTVIRFYVPALEELIPNDTPAQLVFGFRLGSVTHPGEGSGSGWTLNAEPGSFVLMTEPALAERLGLVAEEDPEESTENERRPGPPTTLELMERQRGFILSSERWSRQSEQEDPKQEGGQTA